MSIDDDIDTLLQRYLDLLDQYTTLRTRLTTLQASIHQDIARANFSADRGLRYGQDQYDDRLQASRRVAVTAEPVPNFSIIADSPSAKTETESTPQEATTQKTAPKPPKNALSMFGLLTPPSLRAAQRSAITMVEEVVPQLASLDAHMQDLEIEIRRARKRGRKAAAAEARRDDRTVVVEGM